MERMAQERHDVSSIQSLRVCRGIYNAEKGDLVRVKAEKAAELGLDPETFYVVDRVDQDKMQMFIEIGGVSTPFSISYDDSKNSFEVVSTPSNRVCNIAAPESQAPVWAIKVQDDGRFPEHEGLGVFMTLDGWLWDIQAGGLDFSTTISYSYHPNHRRNGGRGGLRPMTVNDI